MPTVVVYSEASDGHLGTGTTTSYAAARENTEGAAAVGSALDVGQYLAGSTYSCEEAFLAFNTASLVVTAGTLDLNVSSDGSATDFIIEARSISDWGVPSDPASSDFIPGSLLANQTLLASKNTATLGGGYNSLTSEAAFVGALSSAGLTFILLNSSRHRLGDAPTSIEYVTFYAADAAGTTQDPKLTLTATLVSTDNLLNPYSDVSNVGAWATDAGGTTNIYAAIDENVAADADYIQSPPGPATSTYEAALEGITDPASSTGHIVRYRYRKSIAADVLDLTVSLRHGASGQMLPNPDFETNVSGWSGTSVTVARSTAQAQSGSASMEATATSVTPTVHADAFVAVPGRSYSGSLYARKAAPTTDGRALYISWFDSSAVHISNSTLASNVVLSDTSWTLYGGSGAVAPPTAATGRFRLSLVADEVLYIDTASLTGAAFVVDSWPHTGIGTTFTEATQTLSTAEADSITDYSALSLRFVANTTSNTTTPTKVGADRGTASSNTAITTTDIALTGLTVGNTLIVRTAADNSGGGGVARTFAVSNFSGTAIGTPVYDQRNYDPGAASAGTTLNVALCPITATSGTIRLTYGGTVVQAAVAEEWSGLVVDGVSVTAQTVAGMPSIEQSIATRALAYGVLAGEGPSSDTYTLSPDTAGGAWVALTKVGTTNATADANQTTYAEYKAPTAAGSQTFAPTRATARDTSAALFNFPQGPATSRAQVSWAQFEVPAAGPTSHALQGTTAGTSAVTAAIAVARPLAAGVATTSLAAGDLTVTGAGTAHALEGTTAGVSTATAALSAARPVAAAIDTASTASGVLSLTHGLAGSASGATSTAASVAAARSLTGAVTTTSAAAASLAVALPLAGTVPTASTTTASLALALPLAGTVPTTSATTASLSTPRTLAGTVPTSSAATGSLSNNHAVTGIVATTSAATASLSTTKTLGGTSTTGSQATAAVAVARPLAGSVATASITTANAVVVQRGLTGTAAGVSTATASLTVTTAGVDALDGSTAGTTTTTASLGVAVRLAGSTTPAASTSASLANNQAITGSTAATTTTAAALGITHPFVAAAAAAASAGGSLSVERPLTATAASSSATSGLVTIARGVEGTAGALSVVVSAELLITQLYAVAARSVSAVSAFAHSTGAATASARSSATAGAPGGSRARVSAPASSAPTVTAP